MKGLLAAVEEVEGGTLAHCGGGGGGGGCIERDLFYKKKKRDKDLELLSEPLRELGGLPCELAQDHRANSIVDIS